MRVISADELRHVGGGTSLGPDIVINQIDGQTVEITGTRMGNAINQGNLFSIGAALGGWSGLMVVLPRVLIGAELSTGAVAGAIGLGAAAAGIGIAVVLIGTIYFLSRSNTGNGLVHENNTGLALD